MFPNGLKPLESITCRDSSCLSSYYYLLLWLLRLYCCTIELLCSWWYCYVKHMPGNFFILPNQLRYPVSSQFEAPYSCYIPLLVTQAHHFKSFCHVSFGCFVRTREKTWPRLSGKPITCIIVLKQPKVWLIGKLVCFGTSYLPFRSACFESDSRFCMLN